MSYETWFHRGTYYNPEYRIQLYGYCRDPEKLTLKEVEYHDNSAACLQAELDAMQEDLKQYRQALAARYAKLSAMPYKLRLSLIRHAPWSGRGVTFDLRIIRIYEDGTAVDELHEHYTGKQRREALARFEELKKQRPGIEIVVDIERRSWER